MGNDSICFEGLQASLVTRGKNIVSVLSQNRWNWQFGKNENWLVIKPQD